MAIIATGKMVQQSYLANEKYKLNAKIINATFIKPLDYDLLKELIEKEYNILTIEDNVLNGGLGSMISLYLVQNNFKGKIKKT